MDISKNKKYTLSDAFFLFLIPVYGYSLLYAYEYGYFVRLGIPTEFIEINFSVLAIVCAFSFASLLIILGFTNIIYKFILYGKGFAIRILTNLYFGLILSVLPLIAFDLFKPLFPFIIIILLLYLMSEFIFPLIRYKNIKGYWKKTEQQLKNETLHRDEDIHDYIIRRVGHKAYTIIYFLISFTYISFSIGAISAKGQEYFLVLKSDPEVVLLRRYSQHYVCSEFDRNKKELSNKYSILTVDTVSERDFTISREKVGPLNKKIDIKH
jgi:hypothetical protein